MDANRAADAYKGWAEQGDNNRWAANPSVGNLSPTPQSGSAQNLMPVYARVNAPPLPPPASKTPAPQSNSAVAADKSAAVGKPGVEATKGISKMQKICSFVGGVIVGAALIAAALTPVGWAMGACIIAAGVFMILGTLITAKNAGEAKKILYTAFAGAVAGAAGMVSGGLALGGASVAGALAGLKTIGAAAYTALGSNLATPILISISSFFVSTLVGMQRSHQNLTKVEGQDILSNYRDQVGGGHAERYNIAPKPTGE